MSLSAFLTVFATVFVAELGDKTQLATMLYAAEGKSPRLLVFAAAALALVAAAGLAVLAGGWLSKAVSPRALSVVAGTGFILVGLWTLLRA